MATLAPTGERDSQRSLIPVPRFQTNVGLLERVLSTASGAALAYYGLRRGGWSGIALGVAGGSMVYRGIVGHCALYEALGINTAGPASEAASVPARAGVKVEQKITVNRPPEELYEQWRDLTGLPRIMRHLESVESVGPNRTCWTAKGPLGTSFTWEAEIINQRENEMIAWRSLEGSEVDTAGSVHFARAPGGRGTEVTVSLKYNPPGGRAAARLAKLFGQAPEQQIAEDLRRWKQLMEAGEIATTEGQTSGRLERIMAERAGRFS